MKCNLMKMFARLKFLLAHLKLVSYEKWLNWLAATQYSHIIFQAQEKIKLPQTTQTRSVAFSISWANIYGNEWRCFYWEIHLQRFSQHYLHSSRANALNGTTNHRVAHLSQVNFLFSATLPIIFAILTQTNCHLTTFININLCKAKSKKETNLSSPFLLCIFWNYVVSPVAITEFREWFLHKSDQYGKTSWKS